MLAENRDVPAITPLPEMGQSVAQRIVIYQGKVFVTARDRSGDPGAMVLVYALQPTGLIDEVCYIQSRKKH